MSVDYSKVCVLLHKGLKNALNRIKAVDNIISVLDMTSRSESMKPEGFMAPSEPMPSTTSDIVGESIEEPFTGSSSVANDAIETVRVNGLNLKIKCHK